MNHPRDNIMKMTKNWVLAFGLLSYSFSGMTMDEEEIPMHSISDNLVYEMSKGQIEQIIVALRYCSDDDQCLQQLKQAVSNDAMVPFCAKNGCTFEFSFYSIAMPLILGLMCESSGVLLGLSLASNTTKSYVIAGSIMLFITAVIYYIQIPLGHRREIQALLRDFNNVDVFIEKVNKIMIDGINVFSVEETFEGYKVTVSSSAISSLKKLQSFAF
jgi:hypothetical protein